MAQSAIQLDYMTSKQSASYRLSDDARELIELLAKKIGVSKTDIIEIAVRELAQSKGVELPPKK